MRINKFVARATGMSRRAADQAIAEGRVMMNGRAVSPGADPGQADVVTLDGEPLALPAGTTTIMLDKPVGYVSSRKGQGSPTVYDLLPAELRHLKPVGRLDKDSSGLLLLTSDGDLANQLTHPRYLKEKTYEIKLDRPLASEDKAKVEQGVKLEDGPSRLQIKNLNGESFTVTMTEGRNRQIRRTFGELGYTVTGLRRTQFGPYHLSELAPNQRYRVY